MKRKIICVGSAVLDHFVPTNSGTVAFDKSDKVTQTRISFGLGAKYDVDAFHSAVGGCALNMALGLRKFGLYSIPYAQIGDDNSGMLIRERLRKEHVDVSLLHKISGATTDASTILVDQLTHNRTIFVHHGLQQTLIIDALSIPMHSVIFVGSLKNNWQQKFQEIFRALDERDCHLAYNPGQQNIHDDVDMVLEIIQHSWYLFLNKDEATEIILRNCDDQCQLQLDNIEYLMERLSQLGPHVIVITDGANGAWIYQEESTIFIPPIVDGPIVDTTGAGDAFSSGVLAALLYEQGIVTAAAWGAANAASVLGFYGGSDGLLGIAHMQQKTAEIAQKVQVLT